MTVSVESERHLHHPRIYITDPSNIVSLYTLSHLSRAQEGFRIYFQSNEAEAEAEEDLIKKICPRAIKEVGEIAKGMERSVLYLREGMDEKILKAPVEGYHRFVLIISMMKKENCTFSKNYSQLEQAAKNSGYELYCVLRLAPIYQNLNLINTDDLDKVEGEFYGIDAEDVGSAISHILMDPDLHRGEEYSIFSPTSISLSTLKTVHPQLPAVHGDPLQSPQTILETIKSVDRNIQNDFARITGGEEMTSFDEFLRRTTQSLFHQRFYK